jgi:hypothetical protein
MQILCHFIFGEGRILNQPPSDTEEQLYIIKRLEDKHPRINVEYLRVMRL